MKKSDKKICRSINYLVVGFVSFGNALLCHFMKTIYSHKKPKSLGVILIAAVASCYAAFFNGFPLVYTDTGTYLRSGFEGEIPVDRPIFYGLFLRHISLAESLWLVIFIQALITCWLLYLFTGIFFSGLKRKLVFLSSVVLVTLTTGYSYNVSILIPDIFATIALLAVMVLLFSKELSMWRLVLVSIIFVFSLSTHYSNIPIFIMFFVGILFVYWRQRKKEVSTMEMRRVLLALGLFVGTMILIPTVNYSYNGKFRYSESSHVFLFNHMIEIGAAQQYLEDNCDQHNFAICEYREELKWDFLWNYEGPLYKTGGWKENEEDFNEINNGIITTPKYWPLLVHKTIEYTFKQLFMFETSIQEVHFKSAPYKEIKKYLKNSSREYEGSRQLQGDRDVSLLNAVEGVVVFVSSIFLLVLLLFNKYVPLLSNRLKTVLQLVLAYSIFNAAVCANLSTVINRYHNRWAWMLVVMAIIAGVSVYMIRNEWRSQRKID